jgi:hypothetical protein
MVVKAGRYLIASLILVILSLCLVDSSMTTAHERVLEAGIQRESNHDPEYANHRVNNLAEPWNMEYVGHDGGSVKHIAIQGVYAYIGEGASLSVIDINVPTNPTLMGKTGLFPRLIYDIEVQGDYAYIADYTAGLYVVDVSDPVNPFEVGSTLISDTAYGIDVSDNYAYVAAQGTGLWVADVSDPANPVVVGNNDTSGNAFEVEIIGDFAYVVAGTAGLRVIDVSDPVNPFEVGFYNPYSNDTWIEITIDGIYAYVVDGDNYMYIIDISDPADPTEVGRYFSTWGTSYDVAVSGNYAYIVQWGYITIEVIDISDPENPVYVSYYDAGYDSNYHIEMDGNYTYVTGAIKGILVIDVIDPLNPIGVGRYDAIGWVEDLYVSGGYAYLASEDIHIVDINAPANPVRQGYVLDYFWADGIAGRGEYAYIAASNIGNINGFVVVNTSDPLNPIIVGDIESLNNTRDVDVQGEYAYVISSTDGMWVVDISDPGNPVEIGWCSDKGWAITVSGDYAYVAARGAGLKAIDISDPENPIKVGSLNTNYAVDIAYGWGYAFVADGEAGLKIIDVNDPTEPTLVGQYKLKTVDGVVVSQGLAYLAGISGIEVVDVSEPERPVLVGLHKTASWSHKVDVKNDDVYVADSEGGLVILRYTGPEARFSISGRVLDDDNNPLEGVTINISGGYTETTDVQGYYTMTGLISGTYVITPTLFDHVFSPVTREVSLPLSAIGQDFVGHPFTYTVSGQVLDELGSPLEGVDLSASGGFSTTTEVDGYYTFTNLLSGTYVITPTMSEFGFKPVTRTVQVPPDAAGVDFVGKVLTYTVSGQVLDGFGSPLEGVDLSITGGVTTTTDGVGFYTFTNLLSGTYVITPTLSEHGFKPVSRTVQVPPDAVGVDFVGNELTYTVSGQVLDEKENPLPGVLLIADDEITGTTDDNGNYWLMDLVSGTYVITPTLVEYIFNPITRTVSVPPDAVGVDFVGKVLTYTVSGQVLDEYENPLPGVLMTTSNGFTTTTYSNGDYWLTGLVSGTYVITPTLSEYIFNPVTRTVSVPPDAPGQDFVGNALTYTVSGAVIDGVGLPVSGVTILASGGFSTTTDSIGQYILSGLVAGTYSITATLEGYIFEPITLKVSVPPSAVGVDFVAESVDLHIYLPVVHMRE